MMREEYEEVVTEIIANSGMARSDMINAIHAARAGNMEEVDRLFHEAEEFLQLAHHSQTELLQQEIGLKNPVEVSLLMVHAQDHLMTSITVKELATELIEEIKIRLKNEQQQN